ncbi:hypothetical protein QYE76_071265 [Lolium multiflorum]|uniref:Uncharacterized protein n=1 Tax=Lolium multiflorum TaxID=4521 RepID=A0AAD8SM16_LOLMU|nr:hypothetical protein QYE76_071265 [Lolium multiflorum]
MLGVELACFAGLDDLDSVVEDRGPVEADVERFSSKSSRGGVVAALPRVDVDDELLALVERDAVLGEPIGAPAVEFPVNEAVVLGAPYQEFCCCVIVFRG